MNKEIKSVRTVDGRQVATLECGHTAVFDGDLPDWAHVTDCAICEPPDEDELRANAT